MKIGKPQQRILSGQSTKSSPGRDTLGPWNGVGQVPEARQVFSAISPRSRGSTGLRSTAAKGLKLHLALPKGPNASLNASNLSSPRSRPPSAHLSLSRTASVESEERDALIEASKRILARESREQMIQQQMTSPRSRTQRLTKAAAAPALEVHAWTSPKQRQGTDLAGLEVGQSTSIPEPYPAYLGTDYLDYT